MAELVVLRGIPGSGKSTIARELYAGYLHCEADQYFMDNGVYRFDPTRIKEAHADCQRRVRDGLSGGFNVVVSNTFIKLWELQPYIDMANELKIPAKVFRCGGNYGSVHGVPEAVIQRMLTTYEPYPTELLLLQF